MSQRPNPSVSRPFALDKWRALLRLIAKPFRGSSPGATLVEYLVVTGFVSLFAILAFNRFGTTLHRVYQEEARHVRGEGIPNARSILDDLGGLTDPDGLCDLFTGICRPGSGMCFAGGTLVATESGDRPIESVEPGDQVWSTNVETGETALRRVVTTFVTRRASVIELDLSAGSLSSERIEVTPGHHFWVETQGWTRAEELDATPLFSNASGLTATALADETRVTTVYNLEVEDFNTYYVGEGRALVHNQNATPTQRNCTGNPGGPGTGPGTPGGPTTPDPDDGVLECGEAGAYGDLPSSSTQQRDHVPSAGALRKRTEMLMFGQPLTPQQEQQLRADSPAFRRLLRRVEAQGLTIAIPNDVHQQSSETFGGRNNYNRQVADANDLPGAAASNIAAIQAALAGSDCADAYNSAAQQILGMTQADYDRRLNDAISSLTPEERAEIQEAFEELMGGG